MMGVYIKGMEMPGKSKRPLWVVIHSDGVVEYDTGDYGWQMTNAIEVPPHGRLIDADDLDNHILGHVDTRGCPTIIPADPAEEEGE